MNAIFTPDNLIALLTLTSLEIVLGIDNIVFISLIVSRLAQSQQKSAWRLGLLLAMLMRIALLLCMTAIMSLTEPLFTLVRHSFSGRDIILLIGGLFLIGKATYEIHERLEVSNDHAQPPKAKSYLSAIFQIVLLDIVFSLDSVITAVGMAQELWVMIIAVVVAIIVMLIFSRSIAGFIDKHPTLKMLALSFLLLIGVFLVADGLGQHIEKGYIYFAMAFSLGVEMLNLKTRSLSASVSKSSAK